MSTEPKKSPDPWIEYQMLRDPSHEFVMPTSIEISKTMESRQKSYGDFDARSNVSQAIKRAMMQGANWDELQDYQKEAFEMIAVKMSRVLNGDPDHKDTWHDIAGYALQVEKTIERKEGLYNGHS